jgi:hypothetical protein
MPTDDPQKSNPPAMIHVTKLAAARRQLCAARFALSSYIDLTNDPIWPEGYVLWIYSNANERTKESMPKKWRRLAAEIEAIDPRERLDFCGAMLKEMKKD